MYEFTGDIVRDRYDFIKQVNRLYDAAETMTAIQRTTAATELLEAWLETYGADNWTPRKGNRPHKSWMQLIRQDVLDKLYSIIDYDYWTSHNPHKLSQEDAYQTPRQARRDYETTYPYDPRFINDPLRPASTDIKNDRTDSEDARDARAIERYGLKDRKPSRRQRYGLFDLNYLVHINTEKLTYDYEFVTMLVKDFRRLEQYAIRKGDYGVWGVLMDIDLSLRDDRITDNQRMYIDLWMDDWTFERIGKHYGATKQNAEQAIKSALRMMVKILGEMEETALTFVS